MSQIISEPIIKQHFSSERLGNLVSIMLKEIGEGRAKLEAMTAFVTAAKWHVASAAAVVSET